MSIFTFEHILCSLLSPIYPALYLINKDFCELSVSRYSTWVMPKRWYFSWKRMEGIFVYVLEYMIIFVSLDKMQNINTLMRKSWKSEGRAFWKLFKWKWLSPPVKYFYWPFQGGTYQVDHLCNFCIVFVTLSRLLIAAFWLPAGKGLTSWFSFVVLKLCGCYFPIWYPGSGVVLDCIDSWSLPLSYFHTVHIVLHI